MQVDSRSEFELEASDATVPKATIEVVQPMHMHTSACLHGMIEKIGACSEASWAAQACSPR
jgi:hypothetical protein